MKPFSARELLVRAGTLIRSAELRRRAEEARTQFETLLNEAPLGVFLIDEHLRIAGSPAASVWSTRLLRRGATGHAARLASATRRRGDAR